jgi:hypothetical protein
VNWLFQPIRSSSRQSLENPNISCCQFRCMMDAGDLKSASSYINNQLASRGLLRGLPIDFSRPSHDPENPARIINLVHELIQRRDVGFFLHLYFGDLLKCYERLQLQQRQCRWMLWRADCVRLWDREKRNSARI